MYIHEITKITLILSDDQCSRWKEDRWSQSGGNFKSDHVRCIDEIEKYCWKSDVGYASKLSMDDCLITQDDLPMMAWYLRVEVDMLYVKVYYGGHEPRWGLNPILSAQIHVPASNPTKPFSKSWVSQ